MKGVYSFSLAALSGVLLLLSFPPFDLELLAWVALVPVLVAIYYEQQLKRVAWLGILAMAVVFMPQWFEIWYTEMKFWLPESIAWLGYPIALLVGFALASIWGSILASWKPVSLPASRLKYLPTGLWVVVLPVLWVSAEFLIMSIPLVMKVGGALGYASISGTQWRSAPFLQLASYTGMYGVTFLIMLVNSAITFAIVHFKDYRWAVAPAGIALAVLGGVFILGQTTLPGIDSGKANINVVIVQPTESYQNDPSLCQNLMAKSLDYEPNIVLWGLCGRIGCISHFANIAEEKHIYLLQGTELICPDGQRQYWDMPYHMASLGRGFYPWEPSKIVLPPVAPFETALCKLGSLLCMESAYPTPTRELVRNGAQCITTISGNQGFAMAGLLGGNAAYRAVEFRIPSISYRAWGGSIVIDPYGRAMEDIALEKEIVASTIVLDDSRTFYSQYGDVFGYTVVFLAFLLVVYNFYLARRSPYIYCEICGADDMKGAVKCWKCGASLLKPPLWKRILLHEYYEHADRFKKGR